MLHLLEHFKGERRKGQDEKIERVKKMEYELGEDNKVLDDRDDEEERRLMKKVMRRNKRGTGRRKRN